MDRANEDEQHRWFRFTKEDAYLQVSDSPTVAFSERDSPPIPTTLPLLHKTALPPTRSLGRSLSPTQPAHHHHSDLALRPRRRCVSGRPCTGRLPGPAAARVYSHICLVSGPRVWVECCRGWRHALGLGEGIQRNGVHKACEAVVVGELDAATVRVRPAAACLGLRPRLLPECEFSHLCFSVGFATSRWVLCRD
jgi:hypothetical protein